MDDWVIGSKAITKYFGKSDWLNCKRYLQRNGIVLLRLPNGQPAINKPLLNAYLLSYNRLRNPPPG